jgi:hypothetical protein
MELDDLKAKWQQEVKLNINNNEQTMEQLQLLLKEKTVQTMSGMKKKYEKIIHFLLIGILLNICLNPFLHFILGDDVPVFQITYGGLVSIATFVLFGVVVLLYYWLKYTGMSVAEPDDIKHNLINNIARLKKWLRQEIAFLILIFTVLFISGRVGSQHLGNGDFGDIFHKDILLAMFSGILMVCFYIYMRVRAYQKNIKELQSYLKELEVQ